MRPRPRRGAASSSPAAPPRAARDAASQKRKGGRPRGRLDADLLALFGEPPYDDPLKLMKWWAAGVARVAWLRLQGKISKELNEAFRADARCSASVAPLDVIQHAEALVRRAEEALSDEAEVGPSVEEVNDGTRKALRRPAR